MNEPLTCGIHHLGLSVPGLRAAERFFVDVLGWRVGRELRTVTQNLTLHYQRKLYLLADTADNRQLIGKYVEVFQYPDGRIEIRVAGRAVP